jgi:hypothetical protein
MAANPRLTNKTVAPFFNPPNLGADALFDERQELLQDGH